MIVDLADVSQTIILRAAIVAGLSFAAVLVLVVGIVAGAVYLVRRKRTPRQAEVPEYEEAA